MNSHIWKCVQCNKHTEIDLKDDIIHINCQCGCHSTMSINEFIKDKAKTNINDDTLKDITTSIKQANEHLLTYFKTLKDEHMSSSNSIMSEINLSYEESYNRNKDMLTFLEILINNYDGSNEMKKNILDYNIKIYQCKDSDNIDEVIKYYKNYNIIEKEINIEEVKTIAEHTKCVRSLLLLKDGRVASCSWDSTIRIYNPSNDYHCDKVINRHNDGISSICELDDGTIVSSSYDNSIMIGDYTIKDAHDAWISKVITLLNNRIATCSDDMTIKIWKSNPPYSDKPIIVLKEHNDEVNSILYIKERDILISGSDDKTLRLWNMSTYQCDKVIEGIHCYLHNALYQIDSDRVIVGGIDSFCIVNIDKCVIEKRISDKALGSVYSFLKLRDNTILCGCEDGIFCFYDMKRDEYRITRNNSKYTTHEVLLIDDSTFLSCSSDNTIKVWKY